MDLDTPSEYNYGAIWEAALLKYEETAGVNKQSLTKARSVEDVLNEVTARESRFLEHRHDGGKLDRLRSAVSESLVPIERLGHVTATIAGNVYPPACAILGAAQFFISNATSMSDDYDRVVKCFEDVKQYLVRLKILEENIELTAAIKNSIIDVFISLLALFGIFAKYTKIRRTKKFMKTLIFGEDAELKDAYNRLNKMVEQEQRVIAYTTQGDVRQIKHGVTALQLNEQRQAAVAERTKHDTSVIVKDVDYLRAQTDTRTILQWLSSLDFLEKHRNVSEKHQEGTGEWLLQDPNFQLFYQSKDIHSIWCSGIPGAGKTVMTSLAINFIEERFQDPEVAIAYFYCDYKDSRTFSEIQFISSIIKQIVEKIAEIPSVVRGFHDKYARRSKSPSCDEWLALLQSIIKSYDKTFLFIDALDECSENRRRKFLSVIKALSPFTRLFITSRDYLELQEPFPEILRITIEAHDTDVKRFIEAGLEDNENIHELISRDPTLEEEIVNRICEKAAGMFLLADLLFIYICEQPHCQAARDCLNSLPSTVDEFYKETLSRIEDRFQSKKLMAEKALSYIYCSKRPLTMTELLAALGVGHKSTGRQQFAPPEANVLRNATAGLISFGANDIVSLVHYSLQEFFDRNPETLISDPEFDLANTCLTYIMFSNIQKRSSGDPYNMLNELPFLDYASNYFAAHAMDYQHDESLLQKLLVFLTCTEKVLRVAEIRLLQEIGIASRTVSISDLNFELNLRTENMSALHFVAHLGLCYVFERMFNFGFYTDECSETSLREAAWYGSHNIVQYLVAKNVALNALDLQGDSALTLAIKSRHMSIVSTLITAGADPNFFCEGSLSPLELAVQARSTQILSILLKHCKFAELTPHTKQHLFFDAGRSGNKDIIQTLLDSKGEFDKTRLDWEVDYGIEALKGAFHSEDKDMSSFLLHNIPPLQKECCDLNSLLYSRFCDKPIMQSLLQLGADINPSLPFKEPLISHWIVNGDKDILRLLLENGANFNAVGSNSFTPLHCAIAVRDTEKVLLLLEKGANPNVADSDGFAPLYYAVLGGNIEIILLLLEHGAKPDSNDNEGWTPSHFAILRKESKIILRELNTSKAITAKILEDFRHPPLKWCLIEKQENMYLKMFELGAGLCGKFFDVDVDPCLLDIQLDNVGRRGIVRLETCEGKPVCCYSTNDKDYKLIVEDYISKRGLHGWSLFHLASEVGHEDLLRLLLNFGVDINALDVDMAPLLIALMNANVAIAELLIQYGAALNIATDFNQSALHFASCHNEYDIVRTLVTEGADVNAADYWGKTVLMLAVDETETKDGIEDQSAYVIKETYTHRKSEYFPNDRSGNRSEGRSEDKAEDRLRERSDDGLSNGTETKSEHSSESVALSIDPAAVVGCLAISIRDKHQNTIEKVSYTLELEIEDDLVGSANLKALVLSDSQNGYTKALRNLIENIRNKLRNNLSDNPSYRMKIISTGNPETSFDEKSEINIKANLAHTLGNGSENNLEDRPDERSENKSDDRSDKAEKNETESTNSEIVRRTKLFPEEPARISFPSRSALVANFLLQNGASVNTLSQDGCNALHRAAFSNNTEVMELLINAGSDIEVYAEASFRPMDVAIAKGNEAAVRLLLENGASLKADSHRVRIIRDDYDDEKSYDQLLSIKKRQYYRTVASLPRRICQSLLEENQLDGRPQEKILNEWTVADLARLSGNDKMEQIVEAYSGNI